MKTNSHLDSKVLVMNGFTREELFKVMRAVKREFENPQDLVFAMTTENSLEMKLKDVIRDVSEEHAYMKANPPESGSPG